MSLDLSALAKPGTKTVEQAIKQKTKEPQTKLVALRVPFELAERLRTAAFQQRTSQTNILTNALLAYFDKGSALPTQLAEALEKLDPILKQMRDLEGQNQASQFDDGVHSGYDTATAAIVNWGRKNLDDQHMISLLATIKEAEPDAYQRAEKRANLAQG